MSILAILLGDLNSRRGKVEDMGQRGNAFVDADVPLAEYVWLCKYFDVHVTRGELIMRWFLSVF